MKVIVFILIFVSMILSPFSFARDYWGAIAVDIKTGIQAAAWDYSSEAWAEKDALQYCDKKTKNKCTIAMTFVNGCGAAAWSSKTKKARSGVHDNSLKGAEKAALARCTKMEGDGCKIIRSLCTSWDTYQWWYSP